MARNGIAQDNGRITGKDVAALAGVTTATVSRVFNDVPTVNVQLRQKVLSVSKMLNYRPLSSARSLARQSHETIGLVCEGGNITRPAIIQGVSDALDNYKMHLSLGMLPMESSLGEFMQLPFVRMHMIDGLIIELTNFKEDLNYAVARCDVPCVFVNPNVPRPFNSVLLDDFSTAQKATEYLIERGHTKIGYLPGIDIVTHHYSQDLRMQAFITTIAKAGLTPVPLWDKCFGKHFHDPDNLNCGEYYQRAKHLVDNGCTAIVAYNTTQAVRIIHFFYDLGLKVPKDLSIISCDFEPFAATTMLYPITSYFVNLKSVGIAAVDMLIKRIRDTERDIPSEKRACEFFEGGSVRKI